jgi:hypothetical protein
MWFLRQTSMNGDGSERRYKIDLSINIYLLLIHLEKCTFRSFCQFNIIFNSAISFLEHWDCHQLIKIIFNCSSDSFTINRMDNISNCNAFSASLGCICGRWICYPLTESNSHQNWGDDDQHHLILSWTLKPLNFEKRTIKLSSKIPEIKFYRLPVRKDPELSDRLKRIQPLQFG